MPSLRSSHLSAKARAPQRPQAKSGKGRSAPIQKQGQTKGDFKAKAYGRRQSSIDRRVKAATRIAIKLHSRALKELEKH